MEVEPIRPVFGKHDSSEIKEDSAYGTLPLEHSDQNTLKDYSFELISSPHYDVENISESIEHEGKGQDVVQSQLFGPQVCPKQDEILKFPEIPVDVQHPQPSTSQIVSRNQGSSKKRKDRFDEPLEKFLERRRQKKKSRKGFKEKVQSLLTSYFSSSK